MTPMEIIVVVVVLVALPGSVVLGLWACVGTTRLVVEDVQTRVRVARQREGFHRWGDRNEPVPSPAPTSRGDEPTPAP
jgi:hypothetical protein